LIVDPKHLDELIAVEGSYWWHVAKRELASEVLQRYFPPPGRLVEGGIGGGGNLSAFCRSGYEVSGFDIMEQSVEHCRTLGLQAQVHDLQEPWPLPPASTRAVVLLDVIEHVPDPVKVLRNAGDILEKGGGIVVSVPACPVLMGPWDRMLGHYRRYTARMLRQQAEAAGLRVAWQSYWNAFSLPPALVIRTAEKLLRYQRTAEFPRVSRLVNFLLVQCARFERQLLRILPLPRGLSLVGVLVP
jgi:SAM-dependent methyltransferase